MSSSLTRLRVLKQHLGKSEIQSDLVSLVPTSSACLRKVNADHTQDRGIEGNEAYEFIKVKVLGNKRNVGLIELNRPSSLNAIFDPLMVDVSNALNAFEIDDAIGCVIVTGSTKAFSVGADIKQMAPVASFADIYKANFLQHWNRLTSFRKPLIAAVNGYAYGGGCEIAMMCDIIYAGDTAKFGQPEIKIGTIPGAGGTQRLPRAVGKSKAMEMILTGDPITAQEAMQYGLVAGIFPADQLLDRALEKAERISANSHLLTSMAKESANKAFEVSLAEGLNFERRIFHSTFATKDRLEGMTAFIEKRKPNYTNE